MNWRRSLGQHFLISESIAKSIIDSANITKKDIVFELGTGRGILIPHLCKTAKKVISVEADKNLYLQSLQKFSNFENLELRLGDGFKMSTNFSIFVSNLPYSKSRQAIEWLAQKDYSRAVIMVQKEFAKKLMAHRGEKNRRAISVIASSCNKIESIMDIYKSNFSPQPKVDSVVLRLTKKQNMPKNIINSMNKLFSYKRKTIRNVVGQFGLSIDSDKRLEDLTDGEIVRLAAQIPQN